MAQVLEAEDLKEKKLKEEDFSEKSRKELIEICKERNIKGYSTKKKDDIIKMLLPPNVVLPVAVQPVVVQQ